MSEEPSPEPGLDPLSERFRQVRGYALTTFQHRMNGWGERVEIGKHGGNKDVPRQCPLLPGKGSNLQAADEEKPMEDLSTKAEFISRRDGWQLPETLVEAEELAASIERAVQRETGRGVRNLTVEVNRHGVLLKGRCATYYCKQLAQHAAMGMPGGQRLTNSIEVS
ncbi:MAG: hypothetical protein A2V70_14470 [Planctomycetes bacterium RBG_13_63_9]|nr:MAG: hypothetical protein A2V70_14470 [Planctomycetes bacterium RBG_13_63_9]